MSLFQSIKKNQKTQLMRMSIKFTQHHSKYSKKCEHAHTNSYSEFQTDTEIILWKEPLVAI